MFQVTIPMFANDVFDSEKEMEAINKAIKVAKKLKVCVDLGLEKGGGHFTVFLVKPNDSYERVIRRWAEKEGKSVRFD